jgi:hypothetical protein
MERALERLPADRRPPRLISKPRVFSAATARELIAHVVRVNLEAATASSAG